jgi:hypothetical protein
MEETLNSILTQLCERSDNIKQEMTTFEKQFNIKKEEMLKVQGAIEILQYILNTKTTEDENLEITENDEDSTEEL